MVCKSFTNRDPKRRMLLRWHYHLLTFDSITRTRARARNAPENPWPRRF